VAPRSPCRRWLWRGYQQISGLRPRCYAVNPVASGRLCLANMLGAVAHVLI